MNLIIKPEITSNYQKITEINDLAFGQSNESNLIKNLRKTKNFINKLSLVAELNSEIVGHILFYPIKIQNNAKEFETLSLAPMAVDPNHQKQGIGKKLVREGLRVSKELGFKSVIVLGHPDYYPKFGFVPASNWNIKCPFEVPDNAFMAIELEENALKGIFGIVEYPKEILECC